jgi:mono/diheme cytochrome c family protein
MKKVAILLAAAFVLGACAAQSETPEGVSPQAMADDGRDIAEAQCAACHSIGTYGESPMAEAPPFRTVLSRYREEVLKEELIQGIRVTHPMPEFQFNPQSADVLIAYLRSIQQPPQN